MPGWHAKTQALVSAGQLKVAGIVQEQHPDRAKLYMQWQKMTWPVLADSFNDLGISAVPITLLLDKSGVIRFKNPKAKDLKTFLATDHPKSPAPKKSKPRPTSISELEPLADAASRFRLGVAYRQRYDSQKGQSEDFAKAIAAWQEALELNPNQYIWRRRIQQYGPRLDKPYSFYDWVNQARKEITARGETPHPLTAEPGGSEFAYPEKRDNQAAAELTHPDPGGKVTRDLTPLVEVTQVIVPTTKGEGKAIRVHLRFLPSKESKIHWTNDAGNLSLFPEENAAYTIHDLQLPSLPKKAATAEERLVELEIRPIKGQALPAKIKAAAFYYICEGSDGVCRYLRQDLALSLKKSD